MTISEQARPKPLYGQPCNGCGACCIRELCPLGELTFKRSRGPCPALTPDGAGGLGCGLLTPQDATAPEIEATRVTIGAGHGCDAVLTPADRAVASMERPRLVRAVKAADAALSPEARKVVAKWRAQISQ